MIKHRFKNKGIGPLGFGLIFISLVIGAGLLTYFFPKGVASALLYTLDYMLLVVLIAVNKLFEWVGYLFAWVIDVFIILNPFDYGGAAEFLWEFSKNLAYVILIFLALYSGIQWILNKEDEARRVLFAILVIAFLINFTYFLAREIFYVTTFIQKALLQSANLTTEAGGSRFGALIHSVFIAISPGKLAENLKSITIQFSENLPEGDQGLFQRATNVSANFLAILLAVTFTLILGSFAGIAVAKYFIISFLVGILPLAVIAKATPGFERSWDNWWRWFLTWNINFIILIILVLIGVALTATTTGAFSDVRIYEIMTKGDPQWKAIIGAQNQSELSYFFAFLIRYAFLAIYFILVIVASIRYGNKAAEYGYRLTLRGWGLIGAAAVGAGMYAAGRPLLSKVGGRLSEMGDELLKSRSGLLRGLGMRLKGTGEALQKPQKARVEEEAKQIWSSLMEGKSPEEIRERFQSYSGDLRKELAKRIGRELSTEDIIKFATGLDLTKESVGIIKALCQPKLRCALTAIKEGKDLIGSLNRIGDAVDWRRIQLEDINRLLERAGIDEERKKSALRNYIENYATREEQRIMFAHPSNLKFVNEALKIQVPGSKYQPYAEGSVGYRTLDELADAIVNSASNIPSEARGVARDAILRNLRERYIKGELMAEDLEQLGNQVQTGSINRENLITQQAINTLIQQIENDITRENAQLTRKKEQVEKIKGRLEELVKEKENLERYQPPVGHVSRPAWERDYQNLQRELEDLERQKTQIEEEIININQRIGSLEQQKNQVINLQTIDVVQIPKDAQGEVASKVRKEVEIFRHPWGTAARRVREERELEELRRRVRELEEKREAGGSPAGGS